MTSMKESVFLKWEIFEFLIHKETLFDTDNDL